MAIKGAVRWKPDTYRSSLETTVQDLDPTTTPPTGGVVMTAQLVAYDDTVVTGTNYKPGDPATEQNLVVLYEEPITKDLSVFASLTQAQSTAEWTTALTEFKTRMLPVGATLLKAVRAARISPPQVY